MDKIFHDFSLSIRGNSLGPKSYSKIAVFHHYPLRGSEKYAHSYRDLALLLFNAAKLGLKASTAKLEEKLNLLRQWGIISIVHF